MKHAVWHYVILYLGMIGVCSCNKQVSNWAEPPQAIELSAAGDQFLHNFIEPSPEGLLIGISREEALFAGASKAGYADFVSQIERINKVYNAESYKYWTEAVRQRQVATKAVAYSYKGTYDIYNVPEQDRFLENFVYFENEKAVLKISEEKAVLCGATVEGYRALYDLIIVNDAWGQIVREGYITYDELRQSFDYKREFILRYDNPLAYSTKLPPVDPPQTYGTIELKNGTRQGSCSFYGLEEIVATLAANYFCSIAVLTEQDTGKTLTLIGYNTHDFLRPV